MLCEDLTIAGLQEFILTQPPERAINQMAWSTCAVGDYVEASGLDRHEALYFYRDFIKHTLDPAHPLFDLSTFDTYGEAQRVINGDYTGLYDD